MAKNTPEKIKNAALRLFSRQWFETVSIAEICRDAEVSNGVFYRYFPNKTELVRLLLDEFLSDFENELAGIGGETVEERLQRLYTVILDAGIQHAEQVTVFREGQYRFPEYESRLRSIYMACCTQVYRRPVTEAEYLYIISGLRFISTRAIYDGLPRNSGLIAKLVLNGMFANESPGKLDIPSDFPEIPEDQPQDSRGRLLRTGMELIGKKGYHAIGVADIVRANQLAVGTFYTHFESKEQFFSIIVEQIGQETRRYLREKSTTHPSSLEREVYGVWHFLSYFSKHSDYYAIVREAEFVAKPWVRRYYDAFEAGYMHNLDMFDEDDRRMVANFLMGLSHYVGIEALLNRRIGDIPGFIHELAGLLHKGVKE